jgi:hypothetical protein
MSHRWVEMERIGPTPAGNLGGDFQAGQAYSRRWARPMPGDQPGWMILTISMYALQDTRRSLQTEIEFGRRLQLWSDDTEELCTDHASSVTDGPIGEPWPTDEDVRNELAGYKIEIHDEWDGN